MFSNMHFGRTRTAPTGYEKFRVAFHAIRFAQLLAASIVGLILIYFVYHLEHDHWGVPWTFIVLLCVSLLTVVSLTTTIALHCLTGLSPRLNLALNSVTFALWAMGFGMLAYWMWDTLTHHCDMMNWNEETGIMVCEIYKTLFTFTLLGLIATICATTLDLHIFRLATRFGTHTRLEAYNDKRKHGPVTSGPYTDGAHHDNDIEDLPRNSEAFEVPETGYGAHNGGNRDEQDIAKQGYAVPDAQFEYDTGYHGHGGR